MRSDALKTLKMPHQDEQMIRLLSFVANNNFCNSTPFRTDTHLEWENGSDSLAGDSCEQKNERQDLDLPLVNTPLPRSKRESNTVPMDGEQDDFVMKPTDTFVEDTSDAFDLIDTLFDQGCADE